MIDVEDQVREALRAAPVVDGPDHLALLAAVSRRSRRRQARAACAGAVALVVALVGGGAAVRSGREQSTLSSAAAPTLASSTWRSLPASPLSPRFQQQAVWTGHEVVVAGGCAAPDDGCSNRDAAAYDPRARSWRRISDLPAGDDALLVAAGEQVVLVSGSSSPRSWVWKPTEDRWRPLGPVPLAGVASSGTYLTWTGSEVLAVGQFGVRDGVEPARDGSSGPVARLDLASGRWTSGAAAPPLPVFGDAVWSGSELVVAGTASAGGSSTGRGVVAAYDPVADRWRQLPEPPLGPFGPAVGWSGSELVVVGFDAAGPAGTKDALPGPPHRAAALDLATGRWRALPDAPLPVRGQDRFREPVADGRLVLRGPDGQIVTLDPVSGQWSVGSAPPLPRFDAPMVWTGTDVVIWGGGTSGYMGQEASSCCTPVAGGEATPLP